MTVCVAAIADHSVVLGASDRMLSALDVEFETEQSKIWQFSNSIFALIAGDSSIQNEVLKRTNIDVQEWIVKDPSTWVRVKDVALAYCRHYREMLREKAEAEILHPLGLDIKTFLASQATMHANQVADIADQLTKFDFDTIQEMIFMGKDQDGPIDSKGNKQVYSQLYTTYGDKLSCVTAIGFAAIGIGKNHAESQLMFSGHSPWMTFEETLLNTYIAKKRAEAAPGVGKATDIVIVGPTLGTFEKVDDKVVDRMDRIYKQMRRSTDTAFQTAKNKSKELVREIRDERDKQQAQIKLKANQQS